MVEQYFKQVTSKSLKVFFILLPTIAPLIESTQSELLESHFMKTRVSGELFKDAEEKQGNVM
jgi:hypothetical protein